MSEKYLSSEDSSEWSPIVERKVAEDSVSSCSEKSKSKFSLLKKNLKKNFQMSSKGKGVENVSDPTTGKKKKIKKIKDKSKTLPQQSGSKEQEPSTSEKKSKGGSVVRKLSLDKLYSNIKGGSKAKDDKGRRSTTPDVTPPVMSLKEELMQAEGNVENFSLPKEQSDVTYEESELSEDYRTPACQSPVGSYTYDAASQSIHDSSPNKDQKTEFFSSSDPSLESFVSGATTPRSDVDNSLKIKESPFSSDLTYAAILNKLDSSSIDEKETEVESKIITTVGTPNVQSELQAVNTSPLHSPDGSSTASTVEANSQLENTNKESSREESTSSPLSKENLLEEAQLEKTKADTIISSEDSSKFFEKDPLFDDQALKRKEREAFISAEREVDFIICTFLLS